MSAQYNEFYASHSDLNLIVEQIKDVGFKSEQAQEILMDNKSFIMSHLLRAHRDYAPALQAESQGAMQMGQVLKLYATDMKLAARTAQDFFFRYAGYESNLGYAAEYGRMYALLVHCVQKENTVLAMFRRLTGNARSYEAMAV